jgi:RNA polymerase-binding transcription factor DksA
MITTDLEKYRAQLRDYFRRARGTADALEAGARVPVGGQAAGNLSNAPMHLGDVGTEAYLQELNATLFENENHVLAEVADALKRIDAGTFGRCENCGRPIPEGRLEAVPYARYCVACTELLGAERPANLNEGRGQPAPGTAARRDTRPTAETDDSAVHPERIPAVDLEPPEEGHADVHAAGTAGGGTAVGGLAGTNIGDGAPDGAGLEDAMGSGNFDVGLEAEDPEAYAGPSGGAVGGTPANKRAVNGWTHGGLAPREPGDSPTA